MTKKPRALLLEKVRCFRCGGPVFVEPWTIDPKTPQGWLWFCECCGEVDESGVPVVMLEVWDGEECLKPSSDPTDPF